MQIETAYPFKLKNLLDIKTYKAGQYQDLIERIWVAEVGSEEVEVITPPNPYVNFIIPLFQSKYIRDNELITTSQIEGVSLKSTAIIYPPGTKLIGIRFYAFGLYPFFQVPGKKILNQSIQAPVSGEQIDNIFHSPSYSGKELVGQIMHLFNGLFTSKHYVSIGQIMEFYAQFRWQDDACSIKKFCKNNNTNYNSLNRKFSRIVGVSPKQFERLIKFRKSLCRLIDSNEKLTSIATHSGYFDQAHFIREFKFFLHQPPSCYQALIKQAGLKSNLINYNFRLF